MLEWMEFEGLPNTRGSSTSTQKASPLRQGCGRELRVEPCLNPRTVLELLNPGGTFRVRDGVLLDPAPEPLLRAESLEHLAASEAGASILREFCRPGCRSVQLDLEGVGGAVPCVLSVLAGEEEALVGVRVLQLDTLHQASPPAEGLDCGPDEAAGGLEQLDDFQALEASLLGHTSTKRPLSALEASLLGDTKRPFTAVSDTESDASTVLEALERECQELRLKLDAAERRNAKLTAEARAAAAEQERSRTAPLVLKLAPKQPGRSSEKVSAAVQTDSTLPPLPIRTEIAGGKTGVTGFEAGSHPRWLAGILNAVEAQMSKNLPPPPFEAESAGKIGKLLKNGGLVYHPKLGWQQSAPSRRPGSKVAPEEEVANCDDTPPDTPPPPGLRRCASDTTDALAWTKSAPPRRKPFKKFGSVVVCPDPPTTLPAPI